MKKEAFVKIIDSLMDAQIRREKLNDTLSDAIRMREGSSGEKIDLHDLIYDNLLEDSIIDMIELEFGAYGRDRVADYVYEKHNVYMNKYYDAVRDTGELYDDIIKNSVNCNDDVH